MYAKQFLLQIREIMKVLDPKFDSNLQEDLCRSQNSVIWVWIYAIWSVKDTFWKFIFFVHLPLWNVKEYAKMFFSKFQTQISQNTLEIPKTLFLWIWSSNDGLLLRAIHYCWSIMHDGIIGLKLCTKTLVEVVSGNYL